MQPRHLQSRSGLSGHSSDNWLTVAIIVTIVGKNRVKADALYSARSMIDIFDEVTATFPNIVCLIGVEWANIIAIMTPSLSVSSASYPQFRLGQVGVVGITRLAVRGPIII